MGSSRPVLTHDKRTRTPNQTLPPKQKQQQDVIPLTAGMVLGCRNLFSAMLFVVYRLFLTTEVHSGCVRQSVSPAVRQSGSQGMLVRVGRVCVGVLCVCMPPLPLSCLADQPIHPYPHELTNHPSPHPIPAATPSPGPWKTFCRASASTSSRGPSTTTRTTRSKLGCMFYLVGGGVCYARAWMLCGVRPGDGCTQATAFYLTLTCTYTPISTTKKTGRTETMGRICSSGMSFVGPISSEVWVR